MFYSMTTCRQLHLFPSHASRYKYVEELGVIPGVPSSLLSCYTLLKNAFTYTNVACVMRAKTCLNVERVIQ
jgi:hypothetical protein